MPDQSSPCPTNLYFEQIDNLGQVVVEIFATHDGVSVRPNCDGQVTLIHVVNTGPVVWYAHLPNKSKGNPWVQIDPGTDQPITSPGQLNNLGLSTYQECKQAGLGPTPLYGQ
jgi:hypothetical protein